MVSRAHIGTSRRRLEFGAADLYAVVLGALLSAAIYAATPTKSAVPTSPVASAPVELSASSFVERSQLHMGTLLTLRIETDGNVEQGGTNDDALAASERVFAAVARAESRLSTWRDDTELARLNAAVKTASVNTATVNTATVNTATVNTATVNTATVNTAEPGSEVSMSPELATDLDVAFACARLTDGAFDPTIGPLTTAWGLRDGGRLPSQSEIDEALDAVGIEGLVLTDSTALRIQPGLHSGLQLEEGGFGKGAALDDAADVLAADRHVRSAILDFGGQLLVYRREGLGADPGSNPESDDVRANVALADPDDRGRLVAEFSVGSGSVATTGNGERGLVVDGERLGHVLDPRTGRPAEDFGSLTVWIDPSLDPSATLSSQAILSSQATLADCLSTGLYVLGPDAALRFAARHDGVEVVVAERTLAGLGVRASDGLQVHLLPATSTTASGSTSTSAAEPPPGTANRTRDDESHAATHGSSSR